MHQDGLARFLALSLIIGPLFLLSVWTSQRDAPRSFLAIPARTRRPVLEMPRTELVNAGGPVRAAASAQEAAEPANRPAVWHAEAPSAESSSTLSPGRRAPADEALIADILTIRASLGASDPALAPLAGAKAGAAVAPPDAFEQALREVVAQSPPPVAEAPEPLPPPARPRVERPGSRRVSLQEVSWRVLEMAQQLEVAGHYSSADRLREEAARLRRKARRLHRLEQAAGEAATPVLPAQAGGRSARPGALTP